MAISNNSTGLRPGVCTSTTRPTAPYEGQMIYETDTNRVLIWDNAAWVMIADTDTPPGMQLIKTQTIGSGVASVPVTSVFSTDFDNYLITVNGGVGSAAQNMGLQLGATTTGYYGGQISVNTSAVVVSAAMNNTANFTLAGISTTTNNYMQATLFDPFNAKTTRLNSIRADDRSGGSYGSTVGFVDNTTSYTGFTLIVAGTMTGGTIRVYGYRN
jgi:hypothetical protein